MTKLQFCEECGNFIYPQDKKLYCKACDKFFDLVNEEDYKIVKTINHHDKDQSPIILKESEGSKISQSDRDAREEFFS